LDALHIALATISDVNKIISLNFQHILREKTKMFNKDINYINGYRLIDKNLPEEVISHKKTKHY
jgi:hypothetical protein